MAEADRKSFPYPEDTPGSGNSGKFWHQLSETAQTALRAVEEWVHQDNINLDDLGTNDLHHSLLILRYLRANQFNVSKTITHIQKNIERRNDMDIRGIVRESPETILGCSLEELTEVFPHWHSGYDKTGRPVLYKQYGKFDAAKVKKLVGGKDFDPVIRYHMWEQEACARLCLGQSLRTGKIVETIAAVIDIKDMGMSQITSDFLKLTKQIAEVDQNLYPESLGRAFIINAPSAFPLVWRMVKPWLDPATVAKITVLGGPKEYIPVLQEFIGEENLPSNYGGTLPPLSPQVHPYAETMLDYSTAKPEPEPEPVGNRAELLDLAVLEYRYAESTPAAVEGNGKYWHNLSPSSQEALTAVERWVAREKVDLKKLSTADLHPALLLLRYLRANQFNATKTITHLQKNLEWRKTKDIDVLITQSPEAVLGCRMEELTEVFPHWHSGYDKTGRPVLFKQYGKFDAAQVKKLTGGNFDNVVRYHLWEQEACGRLCLAQSQRTHSIVETIAAVIDIKDMGMSQITSDFLKLTKLLAEIDQNQFPETLGRAFIINTPSAFPLVWRMVKPWLDPATVAKITVLGGPKEYIPVLQEFIGEENLPSNYGGTLPPLSPQVHPYAETMLCLPAPQVPSADEVEAGSKEPAFDPEVLTYVYPTTTPGSLPNNGKYWHQLSPASREALTAVEQWVAKEGLDLRKLSTADLHPALMLLRYLRANQFNATKTITHLQKNLEWRKTKDIEALNKLTPEEILGCTMAELTAVFPHWHSGYDKTGRPVLFKQYGKFDAAQVKKLVGGSFEPVVRYHLWEQEACGRLCLAQSHKLKMVVETISAVIDIKDMGMSQITRDFLSLTKLLAEIDQNQYPETLGRAFIINAPSAFPLVWRMVKPWLDPATVAKITVLGGPKEYIPVLQEFIGEENLPSNYGGTLPPLSPQVHPYAETMLTYGSPAARVDQDARAAYARVNDRNSFRNSQRRRSLTRNPEGPTEQTSSLWFYPSLLWSGLQKNWFDQSPQDDNASEWEGGSQHSDDSDDLHFEDAFETQSDLETNSHSHLFSAKPAEGTSTQPAKRKKRSWLRRFFLFKAFRRCYRTAVFDKSLRSLTIQRLEYRFLIAAAVHLVCAVGCAAITATALAEIRWSSSGTRLQLWAYTVVVLMSCFMIIFDLVGYYGLFAKNWPLMVMFASGTAVGTLVFFAVTIAGFLYYSLPSSTGTGNASLNSTLSRNRRFMVSLSIGCLVVTICALVPLILGRGVIIKLREIQGKHLQTRQIQVVLKFAQSISTATGIVMLVYGGITMGYLLRINFNPALFPCYGLIYGGVSVLITSSIGVWVANTVHRSVLRLYQYFVLPFIVALLLCIALVSFDALSTAEHDVHRDYPYLDTSSSEERVKATILSFLLVTGTLTVFVCVFQTISLVATRALSGTIDSSGRVKEKMAILQAIKEKELGIFTPGGVAVANRDSYWAEFSVEDLGRLYMLYSRNQRDRFVIAWAVFSGLFNIFVCGTLAVFSRSASSRGRDDSWMYSLLQLLGRADARFVISNAYLRSSETILALAIGPLLLLYAWATFVYAPYRHVLGILVMSSQMLMWGIYMTIETYAGMKHFHGHSEPVLLAFIIVIGAVMYVLIPGYILLKEMAASTNDTSTSDSHELLMETNDENTPFLNKLELDNIEKGSGSQEKGSRKARHNSDSSMEQMLAMRSRPPAFSPAPEADDDGSLASTRSFILSLGADTSDSSTAELEQYRARAASAFRADKAGVTPLYMDKYAYATPKAAATPKTPPSSARRSDEDDEEKLDFEEALDGLPAVAQKVSGEGLPTPALGPTPHATPASASRVVSPTRLRSPVADDGAPVSPTALEEGRVSLFSPVPPPRGLYGRPPLNPTFSSSDALSSFLRKRSVAPLKPRASGPRDPVPSVNRTVAGSINQVAAAGAAALDPNRILPMLMNLGVSSVEAAGMVTYLMRVKELGDGKKKKKKNSLAMVV